MEIKPYEYRDPGQVVRDVAAIHSLIEGDALIALVRDPSGEQEIVAFSHVRANEWDPHDQRARSRLLRERASAFPIPQRQHGDGPRYSMMTIVARRGLTVLGREEGDWLQAWRYSNHLADAYSGDLVLLTEHGWTDFMTGLGGHEPRLEVRDFDTA